MGKLLMGAIWFPDWGIPPLDYEGDAWSSDWVALKGDLFPIDLAGMFRGDGHRFGTANVKNHPDISLIGVFESPEFKVPVSLSSLPDNCLLSIGCGLVCFEKATGVPSAATGSTKAEPRPLFFNNRDKPSQGFVLLPDVDTQSSKYVVYPEFFQSDDFINEFEYVSSRTPRISDRLVTSHLGLANPACCLLRIIAPILRRAIAS